MKTQSTSVDRGITSVLRPLYDVEVGPEEELEAPMEQEYGIRNPRKLLGPELPSRQEVEERCLSHICPTETGAHVVSKERASQHHTSRIPRERMD